MWNSELHLRGSNYYRTYYKELELKTDIYDKNNCRLWYKEVQNEQN